MRTDEKGLPLPGEGVSLARSVDGGYGVKVLTCVQNLLSDLAALQEELDLGVGHQPLEFFGGWDPGASVQRGTEGCRFDGEVD
ncbi:MAG: hypothetical protein QOE61_173 [Micromonosporaceae bacterium]|jgi:hypothetical protein|nr:hypothetical protein [Micromonosporaceae bacterium]